MSENPLNQGELMAQFVTPDVQALVLMGSFARGDAGPFSDVDLVRFTAADVPHLPDNGSHLHNGRLIVVSQVYPDDVESWFTRPETAVETIAGVRAGQAWHDPSGYFADIQQRAHQFRWDDSMQAKANDYVSRQMVGWIEEVHKGLEGLRRNDMGRLLNGLHGFTWGLARVMIVQRGILLHGDNAFYAQLLASIGPNSLWAKTWQTAFGLHPETSSLTDRVLAGLRLYAQTAVMLQSIFIEETQPLILETAMRIRQELAKKEG